MSVVGFDFGNNACKIAIARKGAIDVIMNDCSNRNTPSVVGYTDANRQIGEAGLAQHVTNYKNTITEVKRLLGRSWADEEFKADVAQLPFKVVADGEKVVVDVAYNNDRVQLSPEQITAALLTHLKSLAENALEIRVSDCVVSVPSFWSDKMRRALLDAAAIAGLNVLRLMNENSAIALQYGLLRQLPEKQPMKTLFFDMGHSQTTVTLVSFVQGSLTMLGSASHRSLGGRDFDRAIANHMMAFAKDKYKLDLASNVKAVLRVLKQCERTKKMLTANIESPFNLECIMNDVDVKGTLTREQFETLSAPLLEQVLIPVRECLALTGVDPKEVDSIELVGGGSRIIAVRRALKEFFGRDLSTTCNADESVARGCALQCAMLSPSVRVREFAVNDVTPLSVTVGWRDLGAAAEEESVVLFSKFNAIPSVKQIAFNKAGPFSVTARYVPLVSLFPSLFCFFLFCFVLFFLFFVCGNDRRKKIFSLQPDSLSLWQW
jgi:molecular chaperone DnaK (HSP70)